VAKNVFCGEQLQKKSCLLFGQLFFELIAQGKDLICINLNLALS